MKIARFSVDGDPRFGILDEEVGELVVLAGDPMFAGYDTTGERIPLDRAKLLAPVIPRSKVVGMAYNYRADGAAEAPLGDAQIFLKPNTSVIGPDDVIRLPKDAGRIVYEGELAVVIGSIAREVSAERALEVVFGYTIANDVTAFGQLPESGPWARAKGYDSFCPLGPVIETELDPFDVDISVSVNGALQGHVSTASLLRSVPEIIEAASAIFTLLPGDVILTGVAASTMGDLVDGAVVDITVEGIGTLSNHAAAR